MRVFKFKDLRAFEELYEANRSRVYRFLSYKLPTLSDAEDVTSDIFLRLWDYAQTTRVESMSGLAFKIARNAVASFYRGRGNVKAEDLEAAEALASDAAGPAEETELIMSIEAVERHLKKLKDEHRDVIIMRYLEEMKVSEIAVALEKTENTVRVLLHRALKAVREIISNQ